MALESVETENSQSLLSIVVFGNTTTESCWTGGWRPIRSSAETFSLVSSAIKREYGSKITTEYVDLANPAIREQHKDIVVMAKDRYMRFPLVFINGEVVFHGSLDYYSLSAAIDKRLDAPK
jgi:disulfide oxidoreductase YuzD